MFEKTIKIFNLEQANFLWDKGAKNLKDSPFGKKKGEYKGKAGIFSYIEFVYDDKFEILMELWRERYNRQSN